MMFCAGRGAVGTRRRKGGRAGGGELRNGLLPKRFAPVNPCLADWDKIIYSIEDEKNC